MLVSTFIFDHYYVYDSSWQSTSGVDVVVDDGVDGVGDGIDVDDGGVSDVGVYICSVADGGVNDSVNVSMMLVSMMLVSMMWMLMMLVLMMLVSMLVVSMIVSMMLMNTVADAARPIHRSKSDLADVKAILSANLYLTNILPYYLQIYIWQIFCNLTIEQI